MRFNISYLMSQRQRQGLRCANLIYDQTCDFFCGERKSASAKAGEIWKSNMRANGDIFLFCLRLAMSHDVIVASVKSAGDIRAGDKIQHRLIVAHAPLSKPFAKIAIEINISI